MAHFITIGCVVGARDTWRNTGYHKNTCRSERQIVPVELDGDQRAAVVRERILSGAIVKMAADENI